MPIGYPESASRSPHGERGLKSHAIDRRPVIASRSPHGERGLKLSHVRHAYAGMSRSPHGERGLKSVPVWVNAYARRVALLMESVD